MPEKGQGQPESSLALRERPGLRERRVRQLSLAGRLQDQLQQGQALQVRARRASWPVARERRGDSQAPLRLAEVAEAPDRTN